MKRLRTVVNLASFTLLSALLAWWAWSNQVTFGLTTPDHDAVAIAFERSPGLRAGIEVTYLGVAVGSVTDTDLRDDHVHVRVALDPDAGLPADLRAEVRRRSALGEPYIELAPRTTPVGEERLVDGATIALEDTSLPPSYQEVFTDVAAALSTFPGDAVGRVVHELSVALDGRAQTLRDLLADTEAVLTTVAGSADVLERLAVESTTLTGWLADLRPELGRATDELELLVADLRAASGPLEALLDEAPDLLERTSGLLVAIQPDASCLLDSFARSMSELDTPENARRIAEALDRGPDLIAMLRDVTHDHVGGPYLRVDPVLNLGGGRVRQRVEPLPYPAPQDPPRCADEPGLERFTGSGTSDLEGPSTDDGRVPGRVDDLGPSDTGRADADDPGTPSAAPARPDDDPRPWTALLLVAVAAVVAVLAAVARAVTDRAS